MRVDVHVLDVAFNGPQRQLVARQGNRLDNQFQFYCSSMLR